MNITLTKGMNGEVVSAIATSIATFDAAMQIVNAWKNANAKTYKVEMYDRFIFFEDCIAIDFGDYSCFLKIDDISDKQMKDIKNGLHIAD